MAYAKRFTKDCKKCSLMVLDERFMFPLCMWGKSKKKKLLFSDSRKVVSCSLRRNNV